MVLLHYRASLHLLNRLTRMSKELLAYAEVPSNDLQICFSSQHLGPFGQLSGVKSSLAIAKSQETHPNRLYNDFLIWMGKRY